MSAKTSCPVHMAIIAEAKALIFTHGHYEHERIISKLNFSLIEDSIQWAYIRTAVQAEFPNEPLIPLTERWFHQRSRIINPENYKPSVNPEKFVAGSGGPKRAAGYGRMEYLSPELRTFYVGAADRVGDGINTWVGNIRATSEKHASLTVVPKAPQISDETSKPKRGAA